MWSDHRQRNASKRGTYAIVHGRAYPRVLKGKNPTDRITAPTRDREMLWRDPAVVLSDADLDECQGGQGVDLCYEHDAKDVVGVVQHTEVADDDSLHLMARIPVKDAEGREIKRGVEMVEEIRAGKVKGFSVRYDTKTQGAKVTGKRFREISLVREPFFEGCDLTVGVMASATSAGHPDAGEDSGN